MELSPLQVAVAVVVILGGILTALSTLVFFVVWLIRLEGRVTRGRERCDDEKNEREKLSAHLDRHIENSDIHFNKQFFFEFKDKIETRLDEMAETMKDGFESVTVQIRELWDSQSK